MANYGLLIIGAGLLIILLLFGGTIVAFATTGFATLNAGIADFFNTFLNSIGGNQTTTPTPTPSGGSPTPTPTVPPSNTVYHVTFQIGGLGTMIWTDATSGTSGTVSKTAYPLGATFAFNSNDKLSVKALATSSNNPYEGAYQFDHFLISGPSGGVSTTNPFPITIINDFTITAYFIPSTG